MAMSRIAVLLFAFAPVLAHAEPTDAIIENAQAKLSVVTRCRAPSGNEITVCGRRAADKWRVPYIGYDVGDPRSETVTGERNRLASEPPVRCGSGAQLRNCGSVGVSVGTSFGRSGPGKVRLRPLAD